jgi:tRNA pseudouridine38-40 synthase
VTLSPITWKLTLAYDGARFHGWQVQPGCPTVQGTLADVIARVTGETVLPQGSGRTDAGVHALAQVASFSLHAPIPAANLLRALNRALPPSIRILTAEAVADTFHARHSALRKTYEYRIFERRPQFGDKPSGGPFIDGSIVDEWGSDAADPSADRVCSPFLAPYAWDCRWPLQLAPMQQAAALLVGTHDFTSFAASDPDLTGRRKSRSPAGMTVLEVSAAAESSPSPVKTILNSEITRENGLFLYRVTGSGFLHHMVRNFVGTLVEVGRGALLPGDIPAILAKKDRAAAGPTAPAHGLYLVRVEYPEAAA